jgi:uncharacterized membrane protein YfcA
LIVALGLIVQGISRWKLRRAIEWPRLLPFLVGGVIGVPLGDGDLGEPAEPPPWRWLRLQRGEP